MFSTGHFAAGAGRDQGDEKPARATGPADHRAADCRNGTDGAGAVQSAARVFCARRRLSVHPESVRPAVGVVRRADRSGCAVRKRPRKGGAPVGGVQSVSQQPGSRPRRSKDARSVRAGRRGATRTAVGHVLRPAGEEVCSPGSLRAEDSVPQTGTAAQLRPKKPTRQTGRACQPQTKAVGANCVHCAALLVVARTPQKIRTLVAAHRSARVRGADAATKCARKGASRRAALSGCPAPERALRPRALRSRSLRSRRRFGGRTVPRRRPRRRTRPCRVAAHQEEGTSFCVRTLPFPAGRRHLCLGQLPLRTVPRTARRQVRLFRVW